MSRRGASPFSVAQRPLRAGRATKPARFYDEEDRLAPVTRVELGKLKIGALRRYAAVFGLDVSGTCTRDELTRAIARHWDDQVLSEGDVLFGLAVALRRGDPASPSSYSYAVQEPYQQQQQQQPLQYQQQQQPLQQQPAFEYQQQQQQAGGGGNGGGGGGEFQQQQPYAQAAGGR